jgi:hypothetical protein
MNDLHVFTTQSAKHIFASLGFDGYDYCMSNHWPHFYDRDPSIELPIIRRSELDTSYSFAYFDELALKFASYFNALPNNDVSFFYCSFTAQLFHLFKYCKKPIHCQLSFRFEGNRAIAAKDIEELRSLMIELASSGVLRISSNSRYDQLYFYHFTGIMPVYIPPTGCYLTDRYHPESHDILIAPSRHYPSALPIITEIVEVLKHHTERRIVRITEAFPQGFTYSSLATYEAIIVIPYAVNSGAFFEYLAMGIPMLFPSARLLAEWHVKHFILTERKPDISAPSRWSLVEPLTTSLPDPNNDFDFDAVRFWLQYCDWYFWNGVVTFDSLEELGEILREGAHGRCSQLLLEQSQADLSVAQRSWRKLLL